MDSFFFVISGPLNKNDIILNSTKKNYNKNSQGEMNFL